MNEHEKADRDTGLAMSRKEFKQLGDGEVAYIKQLNIDLAQKLFPALRGKLEGIDLYAVLGADGRIDQPKLDTVGRLAGEEYCRTTETFTLKRPDRR